MPHNMTVTIEDSLWEEMKGHNDIRWSAVMKAAVKDKLRALIVLNNLMNKTKIREEEIQDFAVALGKKISKRK
ncbi:MAG: hypothetical protein AABX60_00750 [Nanoarchaeota archaeon]